MGFVESFLRYLFIFNFFLSLSLPLSVACLLFIPFGRLEEFWGEVSGWFGFLNLVLLLFCY